MINKRTSAKNFDSMLHTYKYREKSNIHKHADSLFYILDAHSSAMSLLAHKSQKIYKKEISEVSLVVLTYSAVGQPTKKKLHRLV